MEALLLALERSYVGMFFFSQPKHAQDLEQTTLIIFA